jgi:hypothetical protein
MDLSGKQNQPNFISPSCLPELSGFTKPSVPPLSSNIAFPLFLAHGAVSCFSKRLAIGFFTSVVLCTRRFPGRNSSQLHSGGFREMSMALTSRSSPFMDSISAFFNASIEWSGFRIAFL